MVAATIVPDLDSSGYSGKPDILVASEELDAAFITRVSDNFGFSGLKWGNDTSNERVTYELRSDAGGLVGNPTEEAHGAGIQRLQQEAVQPGRRRVADKARGRLALSGNLIEPVVVIVELQPAAPRLL